MVLLLFHSLSIGPIHSVFVGFTFLAVGSGWIPQSIDSLHRELVEYLFHSLSVLIWLGSSFILFPVGFGWVDLSADSFSFCWVLVGFLFRSIHSFCWVPLSVDSSFCWVSLLVTVLVDLFNLYLSGFSWVPPLFHPLSVGIWLGCYGAV